MHVTSITCFGFVEHYDPVPVATFCKMAEFSSASSDNLPVPLGEIYGEIYELCHENVELEAVRGVLEQFSEVCGRYVLNCTDSVGQTMLHYACNRGHLDMVRVLADKELKSDLTIKDRTGDTPLALAAFNGHEDIVRVLLSKFGCDPNAKGHFGRSLLHIACEHGSVSLVRALIREYAADIHARDIGNNTPLHIAASCGKEEVVSRLISEFGCDPNAKGHLGRSVLHIACQRGDISLVWTLAYKHKADPNVQDHFHDTPLHVAILNRKLEVALILINELGCDPNIRGSLGGSSALHIACQMGNVSLVRALPKANIHAPNDLGNTPLHMAALSGEEKIVSCLISEFGCDPNVKGKLGRSALHIACKKGNISLVRTLIQHQAAAVVQDDNHDTPLHLAALKNRENVVLCLISEFGCDPNLKGALGRSALHIACQKGNISLVRTLIQHQAVAIVQDDYHDTPLHIAALNNKENVVLCLIKEFSCDPNVKGHYGQSVLHIACQKGNLSLVQDLIRDHRVDVNLRDYNDNTAPILAACCGNKEVALCLINDYGYDPTVKGRFGSSLLHCACQGGNVGLVQTLIQNHSMEINLRDDNDNTPLHVAAFSGKDKVALCLIADYGCDPTVKGRFGRSVLHCACHGGNVGLVQTLIQNHSMEINLRDDNDDTPLHVAAFSGKDKVALCLIADYGCDPTVKGRFGRSVLHCACQGGNVGLVQTLIQNHSMEINLRDDNDNTPLHVAAVSGRDKVAMCLINDYGCDPMVKSCLGRSVLHVAFRCDIHARGCFGKTLLHFACEADNSSVVRTLIREYGFDAEAEDNNHVRPLQEAALFGRTGVALTLINEFGCDVHAKGYSSRSLLHDACEGGSVFLVEYLLSKLSVLSTDNDGNTPLHTCASHGQALCVEALLAANAPPLIRNNTGQTSMDIAIGRARVVLEEYLLKNHRKLQFDYSAMLGLAKIRHSGEYPVTRLFVLGNPGAGKSSLVESFKTEGFLRSYWGEIPESSVTPHTPGIIPTIYLNKHHGRVLLYDFAGDLEYYSSHAAILENLVSSKSGNNLIIIVVDLRDDEEAIEESLLYWVSFVKFQKFATKLSLLIVGSHSDSIPLGQMGEKIGVLEKFAVANSLQAEAGYFTLDCRKPKNMISFQNHISVLTSHSPQCSLSENASLLFGLLQKDFNNVTACSLQTVLSHIGEYRFGLPDQANDLYLTLSELRDIGILLLLGDPTKGDCHLVLNIPKLTKDVHQSLFSKSAIENLRKRFKDLHNRYNIGILPDSLLKEILPPYITKQCLSYLQYCQEIKFEDIGAFVPEPVQSESSFFFFPALCNLSKGDVSRVTPPKFSYSIGWLAQCTAHDHYFPPRFLHVLLLRLVFRFTLSASTPKHASPDSHLKRRCSMWKTGVRWLMEEGVACQVELVNGSKGVVVITRSTEEKMEDCISVFRKIICCVIESKAEFCAPIRPDFFLLDSTEEADYLTEDNFFAMHEVERALTDPEGRHMIVSVTGNRYMERSRLFCMRKLTHWDTFFPIDFASVFRRVDKVEARYLYNLGLELNMLSNTLDDIFEDFRNDVGARRRKLVRAWLSSSLEPPCWWRLVQALKAEGVGSAYLTEKIVESFGKCNSYTAHLKWI